MQPSGSVGRRSAAGATAALLALALAGTTAAAVSQDVPGSRASSAHAQPLIDLPTQSVRSFSPNGDHRLDQARTAFVLDDAARVRVTVRSEAGLVRGPVRLGRLSPGRHAWTWNGRDNSGDVTPDGSYRVRLRAVAATRSDSVTAVVRVDTERPRGRLLTTRPTAYPEATAVDDHVQLVWLQDGWNAWDEEMSLEEDLLARTQLEIRTPAGAVVWRRTHRDRYTPAFDWYAEGAGGRALKPGKYVAHVLVSDAAGNRRRASQDLRVSHAQLVEEVWSVTMTAARAGRYSPYFSVGCNSCIESADPVASDRFPEGLSFRAAPESWQWGTAAYFASDVPFAEAPVDTYRVTATGGPTTPGSGDQGSLDGTPVGPGDATVTIPWRPVHLVRRDFLPSQALPVTWSFLTARENSYDVATFAIDYRHYVPAA